jgi:hypothetical protein
MTRNHFIYINIFMIISVISGIFIIPSVSKAITINDVKPDPISKGQEKTIAISENETDVSRNVFDSLNASFSSGIKIISFVPASLIIGSPVLTLPDLDLLTNSLTNASAVINDNPTATPTQTVESPRNYERPVIVVDTYSLDQDTISPGNSFILFITLYNAGQQHATNVVATFSSGDLMPRETGGVIAVGEIAPGNHHEFAQPLFLDTNAWGAVASINMIVTYTNQVGISYSETFTITLPIYHVYAAGATSTPTSTPSPTPSNKPQLVITGYTTDISPLQPGAQFKLALNVQNMGNSTAKRVMMIVGGGSSTTDGGTQQPGGISGGSGEFTNFAPMGSSNVRSLGDFSSGDDISAYQPLIVNVNTAPGAYPLKISFVYIDEQNHTFVDDQIITLLVYRLPILEISFYQGVSTLYTGQPNTLPLQVVNLARNSIVLGNMRVSGSSGQFSNNSILVGTLDPGGYFTLDATYIPDQPGSTDLVVSIDYTNDFNQPQVITKTLTVDVVDQPIIGPSADGIQNGGIEAISPIPETFLQKVWRILLGLIGLDSGLSTIKSSNNNQPIESPTSQPLIVPVKPLKGP